MKKRISIFEFGLLLLAAAAIFTTRSVHAAAINTEMALAPAEGTTVVRSQFRYTRATDDPSGMGRESGMVVWSNTAVHGVSGDFIVGLNVPVINVELDSDMGTMMDRRGIGDITLITKYRFWQHDLLAYTDRISGIFGVEVPSGDDDFSSHSLDPLLGVVFTHQSLSRTGRVWEIDADLVYRASTEARDIDSGNMFRYDFAFGYQLWPGKTSDSILMAILEINGAHSEQDWIEGGADPDSGGHRFCLSPGLAFVTRRFIVETGVSIPVVQDLRGDQLNEDFSATVGVRFQF